MEVMYSIPLVYWSVGEEKKIYIDESFCRDVLSLLCERLGEIKKSKDVVTQRERQQLHFILDVFLDGCGGIED